MIDIVDRLKACETRSLVTMSEETGQLVRSSDSWVELWRCLQDAAAEIARLRLAVADCVAEKAADWKAACESAELASKEIGRLRLTDEEREAIWTVAEAYAENDGDLECERIARIMQGLWQRTKREHAG